MTIKNPKKAWLISLSEMLDSAQYSDVAGRMLMGFMWSCWPEWFTATKERALQKRGHGKP